MNPLQVILDFFVEIINRIRTKSPAFFKILQLIGASLTFAGYFPSMLQVWFGVEVPGKMIGIFETVAHYATGFWASSALAVKAPIVGQTEQGAEVRVTDQRKMPLTAKAEQKEIAKIIPPPDVLEEVKVPISNFPDSSSIPTDAKDN